MPIPLRFLLFFQPSLLALSLQPINLLFKDSLLSPKHLHSVSTDFHKEILLTPPPIITTTSIHSSIHWRLPSSTAFHSLGTILEMNRRSWCAKANSHFKDLNSFKDSFSVVCLGFCLTTVSSRFPGHSLLGRIFLCWSHQSISNLSQSMSFFRLPLPLFLPIVHSLS